MEKYGRLTIISKDPERKGYVICKCDCGNTKSIRKNSLTRKKQPTQSCGCIHNELIVVIGKKTIEKNSANRIATNKKFNTNFEVIRTTKPPKNNSSGYKGVSFDKTRNNWATYINIHDKRIFLGRFATLEEATECRKNAEEKYYKPLLEKLKQGEQLWKKNYT